MQNSLKDKVLEAIDIVEVVGERVSLTRRGKDFMGLCPFHDDHKPSMAVSPSKQIFKCWSCGVGGDVIRFVQLSERLEFKEALAILARRAGIELRRSTESDADSGQRDEVRRVIEWARGHFCRNLTNDPGGPGAFGYARKRGLSDDTIASFKLGFAADTWDDLVRAASRAKISPEQLEAAGLVARHESGRYYDRFRNRLIFPIHDAQGRPIAFGGRTLADDAAKYLNSPETPLFSKSRVLFALDAAAAGIRKARAAIVVEGYMDAVSLHQTGVTNVVATLGTAMTDSHAKSLSRMAETVYLCFDPDDAGSRAADRAVETALSSRLAVRVVCLPAGQDPSDFAIAQGRDAFYEKLQSSVDALEFKWSLLSRKGGGAQSPAARRSAAEAFLQFIGRASLSGGMDPLDQGFLVGRLSEVLNLPAGSVHEMLASARAAIKRSATSSTPDTSERSAYVESLGEVPSGVVAAVEGLFGLLISDSRIFDRAREQLATATEWCPTWRRLFEICDHLFEDRGGFSRADVMANADDSALCELIGRASEAASNTTGDDPCGTLCGRLGLELDNLRMRDLSARLGGAAEEPEQQHDAFAALLNVSRRRHDSLAPGAARRL
ncbi:MAG: DNA primase [Phycisphaerae bacterium]